MAKNRYVDPFAAGANDGTSWADAWTSLAFSGLAAGDTVYISGGPAGGTVIYDLDALGRTYSQLTSVAGFKAGTLGNPVTYKIGQESGHNGTALFTTARGGDFIFSTQNVIISGDAGDGGRHFALSGFNSLFSITAPNAPKLGVNMRINHFDLGEINRVGTANPIAGLEVDHI